MFLRILVFCLAFTMVTCTYCETGIDIDSIPSTQPLNLTKLLRLNKALCSSKTCVKFTGSRDLGLLGNYNIVAGWCMNESNTYEFNCDEKSSARPVTVNLFRALKNSVKDILILKLLRKLPSISGTITCCKSHLCNSSIRDSAKTRKIRSNSGRNGESLQQPTKKKTSSTVAMINKQVNSTNTNNITNITNVTNITNKTNTSTEATQPASTNATTQLNVTTTTTVPKQNRTTIITGPENATTSVSKPATKPTGTSSIFVSESKSPITTILPTETVSNNSPNGTYSLIWTLVILCAVWILQ